MATLTATAPGTSSTPKHLWIVGIVALLWNSFGAFDYLMTHLNVESYMSSFTDEQRAYYDNFPAWAVAFWALGVWGAFFGSVALLLRSRWAVTLFAVSLLGLVGSALYTYVLSDGLAMMSDSTGIWIMTLVIWIVAIGLYFYARAQKAQGVLR